MPKNLRLKRERSNASREKAKEQRLSIISDTQDLYSQVLKNISLVQSKIKAQQNTESWDDKDAKIHHLMIRYSKLAAFLMKRIDSSKKKQKLDKPKK